MYRLFSLLVAGLCLAATVPLAAGTPAAAEEKSSVFRMDIPAGKWKVAKFRGLRGRGSLSLDVVSSGPIEILLFDKAGYRRFPAIEDPLFRGKTDHKFGFSVVVPKSGDYYLVIDNRTGDQRRRVSVRVKAATAGHNRRTEAGRPRDMKSVNAMLTKVAETLKQVFRFDTLTMRTRACGKKQPPPERGDVVICTEYAARLLAAAPDRPHATAALMYSLFHQVGAALEADLARARDRTRDRVDELATVLMRMFDQDKKARMQALYFASLGGDPGLARKLSMNRHRPMTVRRARNILGWLEDPDLVKRWQGTLVPRMRTKFLKRLRLRPMRWTDRAAVMRELARRRATGQPI